MSNGDVYYNESTRATLRILMHDNIYFYAEYFSASKWSVSSYLNSFVSFFGTGVEAFLARQPKLLYNLKYTHEERSIIRPDLPLSIGRNIDLNWKSIFELGYEEFNTKYGKYFEGLINADKLIVFPMRRNSRSAKGILLISQSFNYFLITDLIWQASKLQESAYNNLMGGIGIFRIGIKDGLPTYGIDNYYFSNSDIYINYELGFNWKTYFESQSGIKRKINILSTENVGCYFVEFDRKNIILGKDIFAIKNVRMDEIILSFIVTDLRVFIDLRPFGTSVYYFGFIEEGEFKIYESLSFMQ